MSTGHITPKNILRHNRTRKKIKIDELLEFASSDNVSDALKEITGKTGLIDGVKPIDESSKVVGKVRTAYTDSNDWGTSIKAIYNTNPGEVLFIHCSDDEYAVWGGLASSAAKKQGIIATVIYGASRDTEDIIELDYPVFSRNITSHSGKPLNNGILDNNLVINGNLISNGDVIICDIDGVVVIPKDKIDQVLSQVKTVKEFEDECIKKLESENLDDILEIE